ncbi:hypothetical protein NQ317_012768 [Molorchus minor]|uniref:Transcription factor IIIC 90kDa subunit N-terminal domain-containing protein n=1 Tax=Molorchus minor TaxID=1323400 RepID=A0ABQ9K681_9CUCU|nr:hypothetical protein NQ317_012768 [Molorchus minor]
MLSTEYSANVKHAAPVEPTALKAEWSPRGIVGKTDCALAVLTNLYSLEVYVKHVDENELVEYCLVCNVFKEIYNVEKSKWSIADKFSAELKLAEMKKRLPFTWSHLYKLDNTEVCVIFVGHMNGDISIWRMNLVPTNSKEQISLASLGRYSTHLKRIVTLYWHPTMEFGGGLCYADTDGKMSILQITDLDQEAANISSDVAFWTVADKVPVDRITVMTLGGCTYIVLVKQSFLIINGITKRGVVFDQKVENVGNFYITGVYHYKNIILVLTMTGIFKQYVVSTSKSDKILLEEKVIPLKVDLSKLRTHGFFFSKNMVLFGMVVNPYQLRGIARVKSSINMFLFHNVLLNPLYILWQNDTGSLRDHWDCFEALRLICIKDKRFPWLGLPPDLNYDHLSLLQLKTLRWVAKLSETVFNLVPYIRNYDIKPYIILHYLVEIRLKLKRINTLLNLRNTGKHLSLFQMRSIDLQNFFLKEMVVKNILLKANVGRNFVNEMRDVISIANELRYPPMSQCVWCGENILFIRFYTIFCV